MIEADAARRVPLEPDELEYLINKKNEDIARQVKVFRISLLVIGVVTLLAGIGLFAIIKLFPETFVNRHEAPPNVLVSCLTFAIGLLSIVIIANVYSYINTTGKLAKDIAEGKKKGRWFGIIFGAEGLGIFIAVNVVTNMGHSDLVIPVIALRAPRPQRPATVAKAAS